MADIAFSNRVIFRSHLGRFLARFDAAVTETVRETIERGADLSRSMAPVGVKHDHRTLTLKASIKTEMLGTTSGRWYSTARHALPVEKGARPHLILGNPSVSFFWESRGRQWIPAAIYYRTPGMRDVINHPGNRSQPFLRPAYEIVTREMVEGLRKNYRLR